jgi:hypothetical protein
MRPGWVGGSLFAGYALARARAAGTESNVERFRGYLVRRVREAESADLEPRRATYCASLVAMFLADQVERRSVAPAEPRRLRRTLPKWAKPLAAYALGRIEAAQGASGLFGYSATEGHGDASNTQFASLGLLALHRLGMVERRDRDADLVRGLLACRTEAPVAVPEEFEVDGAAAWPNATPRLFLYEPWNVSRRDDGGWWSFPGASSTACLTALLATARRRPADPEHLQAVRDGAELVRRVGARAFNPSIGIGDRVPPGIALSDAPMFHHAYCWGIAACAELDSETRERLRIPLAVVVAWLVLSQSQDGSWLSAEDGRGVVGGRYDPSYKRLLDTCWAVLALAGTGLGPD